MIRVNGLQTLQTAGQLLILSHDRLDNVEQFVTIVESLDVGLAGLRLA